MINKKIVILIALIACVVIAAGSTFAYIKIGERNKDKLQIGMVNKYLTAYRSPDLGAVKDLISDDMRMNLPGDQKAFKAMVERTDKANGRIKNWKIVGSDTNEYIGQTMVVAKVNTTKSFYEVVFDIVGDDKQGWKIRAVKDLKTDQAPSANMGGMGQKGSSQHGMQ